MDARKYDLRVNWERRLIREWPFYREVFKKNGVNSVLDCACGTGRHAILFREHGFSVAGSDKDPAMIETAKENAAARSLEIPFTVAAFSELASRFPPATFDAVICVGNSLSQLRGLEELREALEKMASVSAPGGLLVLHILNYASLMKREVVAQPLRVIEDGGRKSFLQKVFIPQSDEVAMLWVTIAEGEEGWVSEVHRGRLLPIRPGELQAAAEATGFSDIELQGDYTGGGFEPESSWDLILTARRNG